MIEQDFVASNFRGAVVLIGSMISADKTTGLPNGMAVSDGIINRLVRPALEGAPRELGLTSNSRAIIERIARESPFEIVLENYPDKVFCRDLLVNTYSAGANNRYHDAIASGMSKGYFAHVITTNYDTLLERAGLTAKPVVDDGDRSSVDTAKQAALFKIHGCVTKPDSIVYHLSQEGMLPKWKQDFLIDLVSGRDLVVIGYSGRDFDICPILLRSNYRRLIWLFRSGQPLSEMSNASHNLRHVHNAGSQFPNIFATGGGFDRFLAPLLNVASPFEPLWGNPALVDDLFSTEPANPDRFHLWRAAFLHAIACPVGTSAALSKLSAHASEPRTLDIRAGMMERVGAYATSNEWVRQARSLLNYKTEPDFWLDSFAVEAGRFYTAGNIPGLLNARKRYHAEVSRLEDENVLFDPLLNHARRTYLDILRVKGFGQIPFFGGIAASFFGSKLERDDLARAAQIRYERGEWQDLHLIRTAANDLGISLEFGLGGPTGSHVDVLLSHLDSFSQLNNLVGRASAYRRSSTKQQSDCEELLEALAAFGHYGEFWKAFRSFGSVISDRHFWAYLSLCRFSFRNCQYYAPLKLVRRVELDLALKKMKAMRKRVGLEWC